LTATRPGLILAIGIIEPGATTRTFIAVILASFMAIANRRLNAQDAPTKALHAVTIRGRVVDSLQQPLDGVEVTLSGRVNGVRTAITDGMGRFSIAGTGSRFELKARRPGYRPLMVPIAIPADSTIVPDFKVVLFPLAARELPEVVVNATQPSQDRKLREFAEHRKNSKFGYFFDQAAIEKTQARRVAELLRSVPGTRLIPSAQFGSVVRIRGCRPLIWIDGQRIPNAELDEVMNIRDIAAIEVYNSFAGIPAQFIDRETSCGAVVVWMKTED
jgi:hypothetical protein